MFLLALAFTANAQIISSVAPDSAVQGTLDEAELSMNAESYEGKYPIVDTDQMIFFTSARFFLN